MGRYRMASGDAAWLHMDRPVNELVVNAVLWFDDPLDDEALRPVVEDRLIARFPQFRRRVEDEGRAAWWVDVPSFDVDHHLVRVQLAAPGGLQELHDEVTRLIAAPLPRDRPLWQLIVVDGYRGGGALVARMHHCIADGVALFRVLMSLSDEAHELGVHRRAGPGSAPPSGSRPGAADLLRGARALGALVGLPPDRRTALRRRLGTAKTVAWSEPIPLEALRTAARAAGATINDLALVALSGALRTHLQRAGGPVRDVRAVLPVNLRPFDEHEVDLGNRFGLVFVRLPVVASAADGIALIRTRTAALKRSAMPVVALGLLRLAGHAPYRFVQLLIGVFSAKASVVMTNVPGPTQALHLGGNRLAGTIAWPPQSGSIGVSVSLISYAGNVVIGVMADDGVVPDPRLLLTHLRTGLTGLGVPEGVEQM